jgi:hypothetical protein
MNVQSILTAHPNVTSKTQSKFTAFMDTDLMAFPDPVWLIDGMIEEGAFGVLYGPPATGKSFIALDWALSVAKGVQWQGRTVQKGLVAYIVGEGTRGIKKRVMAWKHAKSIESAPRAFWTVPAPHMLEADDVKDLTGVLLATAEGKKFKLIIIDTLATTFVGGDENTSKDMGAFVDGCRQLQQQLGGATVLVVHHTGKNEEGGERGSSALKGAADFTIRIHSNLERITLKNEKQKDNDLFPDVHVRLREVVVPHPTKQDVSLASCVVEAAPALKGGQSNGTGADLHPNHAAALKRLLVLGQAQTGEWRLAVSKDVKPEGHEIPTDTFEKWRKKLFDLTYIEKNADGSYSVTALGKSVFDASPAQPVSPSSQAPSTTTPL